MALIETIPVKDDYRRKLAYKLMMEGVDASPVQHWAQGLARLGQSAIGGYEMYMADKRDKETEAGNNAALIAALGGGAPAATPAMPTPQRPTVTPSAPVTSVTPSAGAIPEMLANKKVDPTNPNGGIYGGLGFRPLDSDPPPETKTAALSPMAPTPVKTEPVAAATVPTPTDTQMADAKARLVQMLQSDNPQMRKLGQNMAQAVIAKQLAGKEDPEYDYKTREDGAIIATNKKKPDDLRIIRPPGASDDLVRHAANVDAAKKSAAIAAEAQATAKTELPGSENKMNSAMEIIQKVRNHPGREAFGGAGAAAGLASFRPGSEAYDFKVMVDQLKGGSFLQAYETLKGGGPIANAEGEKAMAAVARLDRAQTPAAFDEALTDYENAIKRGFASLQKKAGIEQPSQSQGGAVVWERGPDGKPRRKQ